MDEYQTDSRVLEVARSSASLEEKAETLEIRDDQEDTEAKAALSVIAAKKKDLELLRKSFVAPLNDHVKNINTFFKERSMPLIHADEIIRGKVARYFSQKQEAARIEQQRLLRLAQKRQERLDTKAQEKGKESAPPVPVAIVETPEKTTKTEAGSVTVRKVWDFRILEENLIPREYLMVDEKKIRAIVRAGIRQIPGVHIFEREELTVR